MGVRDSVRYSESFKLKVVREIEEGLFRSGNEAKEAYGIGGSNTIYRWIREYGKDHLLGKVVHVRSSGEVTKMQELKDRVRKLEAALADAHMDQALSEGFFKFVCEDQGLDPEAVKKKFGAEWSNTPAGPFRSEKG
jgi:transposase